MLEYNFVIKASETYPSVKTFIKIIIYKLITSLYFRFIKSSKRTHFEDLKCALSNVKYKVIKRQKLSPLY